ncbi:hypothetical protein HPULCUR_007419 [Helicostylum pulchrum]|uniref:PiggyBac transposable element-derived protein domain-containing protein n=1 Tax=Helicostylum pulchrum TaxID=562976 RepID=A0ABP9Y4P3_9FUNG
MSGVDDFGRTIFVCSYRDKKAKALISSCSTTSPSTRAHQEVNGRELRCPQVFEDYESQKSSVNANNNRRDNMISFHDVMKTYRWEVLFLSFVFGITEANAFSCYKIWGNNAEGILHSNFKCRLSQSLLEKVKDFESYEDNISLVASSSNNTVERQTTEKAIEGRQKLRDEVDGLFVNNTKETATFLSIK